MEGKCCWLALLSCAAMSSSCGRLRFAALDSGHDAFERVDASMRSSDASTMTDASPSGDGSIFLDGLAWADGASADSDAFDASSLRTAIRLAHWIPVGGSAADQVETVASRNDRLCIGGRFEGSIDVGGQLFSSAGRRDSYAACYDQAGAHVWSRAFGGTLYDHVHEIAIDSTGGLVVVGYFNSAATFGGPVFTPAGGQDAFVVRFHADGTHDWSQRFGGTGNDGFYAVTLDSSDNLYVVGYGSVMPDFGGGMLDSEGANDIVVASYDLEGNHRWSKLFGSTVGDQADAVAVAEGGPVVIAGDYGGPFDLEGTPVAFGGGVDTLIAAFTLDGVLVSARSYGASGDNELEGMSVAPDGSFYAAGHFEGSLSLTGSDHVSAGDFDALFARFDENGDRVDSHTVGGASADVGEDVAVDAAGNAYIIGDFTGSVDFGGTTLVSRGGVDVFVASYAGALRADALRWAIRMGSDADDLARAVAVASDGRVYAVGSFVGEADVNGEGVYTAVGATDGFVAVLVQY